MTIKMFLLVMAISIVVIIAIAFFRYFVTADSPALEVHHSLQDQKSIDQEQLQEATTTETQEHDGISLTITIGKPVYKLNEKVEVTVIVQNVKDASADLWRARSARSPVKISVNTFRGSQTLGRSLELETYHDKSVPISLAAGQKLVRKVTWDQMVLFNSEYYVQVPPGSYKIEASLYLGLRGPILSAAATTKLEGGSPIIPDYQALEKAIAHPQVSSWLESTSGRILFHSYGSITGHTFREGKLHSGIEGYSPFVSRPEDDNIVHCEITGESGPIYRLRFQGKSKLGDAQAGIIATLDATNGEVRNVESDDK